MKFVTHGAGQNQQRGKFMKTSFLILGVLGGLVGPTAAYAVPTAPSILSQGTFAQQQAYINQQNAATAKANFEANFVPRDPWRAINGATNYVKIDGVVFCGKIVDVTKEGVRIEGSFGKLFDTHYNPTVYEYQDFFVANFPFEVVTDQVIPESEYLMAWQVGTYTYSTVNGGSRTIKKLDYGTPSNPPAELIQKQIEAAKARAIADKKRVEQGQIAAVKFLQPQATNGDADSQCQLALHYLNGQGCETNREAAIYWLQKSAAQGNRQASNKLVTLKP
jgi:hypothetical protein